LLAERHGEFIYDLWNEYEQQKTEEAKFVKAVDKLQCTMHTLHRGLQFYTPEQQAYEATYAIKAIQSFPLLKPFYQAVQEEIKRVYLEKGLYWDDKWFLEER